MQPTAGRGGQGSCSLQKHAAARTNREAIGTVRAGTVQHCIILYSTCILQYYVKRELDLLKRIVFGGFPVTEDVWI